MSAAFAKTFFPAIFLFSCVAVFAQDNSPYSRYGLGDIMSSANVINRGMGGFTAAYADGYSVNFSNPASYSQFQALLEQRSKKLATGRVVLDVGLNFDNRTLIAPNTTGKFTSSDALFSYVQLGVPLRKNWGLSFGIRPVNRISYNISREEFLTDPISGNPIENTYTQFRGSGGAYLPSIGTGFGFDLSKKTLLSFGVNMGYLFGRRESQTLRSIINDSVVHYGSEHKTSSSFGDMYFNAGMQFQTQLNATTFLRLGASGNWEQKLSALQDLLRQTYILGSAGEILQVDSVFQQNNMSGKVVYPATLKAGFMILKSNADNGWSFGADYTTEKWSSYRSFGKTDSVQDSWMVNVGGQFYPRARSSYFSKLIYRFGFNFGEDYILVSNKLPLLGVSFGAGIPIRRSRTSYQETRINISLEYNKRGNNDNLLKENLFRASVGLNLSDLWFGKRKYD